MLPTENSKTTDKKCRAVLFEKDGHLLDGAAHWKSLKLHFKQNNFTYPLDLKTEHIANAGWARHEHGREKTRSLSIKSWKKREKPRLPPFAGRPAAAWAPQTRPYARPRRDTQSRRTRPRPQATARQKTRRRCQSEAAATSGRRPELLKIKLIGWKE